MFLKKFHRSFHRFIDQSHSFNDSEKLNIYNVFKKNTMKSIFNLSIILIIWAFLASWIDIILFSGAALFSLKNIEFSTSLFFPFLLFISINATLKFIFVFFYTKKITFIKKYHIFLAVIPYIGSFYIIGILLSQELVFFSALKKYIRYIKKEKGLITFLKEKTK